LSLEFILAVLLPLAAFSGWWVAKRGSFHSTGGGGHSELSAEYFSGLNYLLNEQPDKAVDVFVKMLEVDSETVETHLALGNLFRRRGEGDRAIRIHQNLIARPTLTRDQRTQALLELGKDYMRAGFLDRAENLFLELVDDRVHRACALDHLLDIYQQEKDWEKAILTARKIEANTDKRMSAVSAQFCCELAEMASARGEKRLALKTLKRAVAYDKTCVRATLLIGQLEKDTNNYKAAIRAYKQVEHQDPTYLSEIIEPLVECHQALGMLDDAEIYLKYVLNAGGGTSSLLALADIVCKKLGELAAAQTIIQYLKKKPSVKGLDRLIEYNLVGSEGAARENLQILKDITAKLVERYPIYKCDNCGFTGKTLHWQCPTCRTWNSTKPILGIEGE
jgi:lipopolysaccharide biosynthesis regulator YciM